MDFELSPGIWDFWISDLALVEKMLLTHAYNFDADQEFDLEVTTTFEGSPVINRFSGDITLGIRQSVTTTSVLGVEIPASFGPTSGDYQSFAPNFSIEVSAGISEPPDDVVKPPTSYGCLLYTSPSPRDATLSRMPSSA